MRTVHRNTANYTLHLTGLCRQSFFQNVSRKDPDGFPVDSSVQSTLGRIAKALSSSEERRSYWEDRFLWALESGFLPSVDILQIPRNPRDMKVKTKTVAGWMNLAAFVLDPFTEDARIDWKTYERVVSVATRLLDNVWDFESVTSLCRIQSLGVTGLASACRLLGVGYGTEGCRQLLQGAVKRIAEVGLNTGVMLAFEKGATPAVRPKHRYGLIEVNPSEILESGMPRSRSLCDYLCQRDEHTLRAAGDNATVLEGLRKYGSRFVSNTGQTDSSLVAKTIGNGISEGISIGYANSDQLPADVMPFEIYVHQEVDGQFNIRSELDVEMRSTMELKRICDHWLEPTWMNFRCEGLSI